MIDRLWTGRRLIESVVLSVSEPGGDFLVSILPALRWVWHKLSRVAPARSVIRAGG